MVHACECVSCGLARELVDGECKDCQEITEKTVGQYVRRVDEYEDLVTDREFDELFVKAMEADEDVDRIVRGGRVRGRSF